MKITRILVILTVLLLVAAIGFIIYAVHSRTAIPNYQFQVDAVLSAASIANEDNPLTTESDKCVIAEYEGRRAVVVPDNYPSLSSYLKKDAACPLFVSVNKDKALKLSVCDIAVFYIMPEGDSTDVVLVEMDSSGKHFGMRIDGGNLWPNLLESCMKGTYHGQNIPLD